MADNRKVYGDLNTPETLKVLACLFEHDLSFEFVPIDRDANQHKQKQFLSMSPFGQVPVLDDRGLILFESRAITRYMGHEYGKKIHGEELIYWQCRNQALLANWIDVEDHSFEPPALKLISLLSSKPNDIEDIMCTDHELAELNKVLDVYEAQLGKFKYLACDKFTIVDVLHLPNLHSLVGITATKKLIESHPRVSAWCYEILARPSWSKVLQMQQQHKMKITQA